MASVESETIEENLEKQEDEILALESILEDDFEKIDDSTFNAQIISGTFNILVQISFDDGYPSHNPPQLAILDACEECVEDDLKIELLKVFELGEIVVYDWITVIEEYLQNLVEIKIKKIQENSNGAVDLTFKTYLCELETRLGPAELDHCESWASNLTPHEHYLILKTVKKNVEKKSNKILKKIYKHFPQINSKRLYWLLRNQKVISLQLPECFTLKHYSKKALGDLLNFENLSKDLNGYFWIEKKPQTRIFVLGKGEIELLAPKLIGTMLKSKMSPDQNSMWNAEIAKNMLFELLKLEVPEKNERLLNILHSRFKDAPDTTLETPVIEDTELCEICYSDFNETDTKPCRMKICSHQISCETCVYAYCQAKIHSHDVMPWICCIAPDCQEKMDPDKLYSLFNPDEIVKMLTIIIQQNLKRESCWVGCQTENCGFGFVVAENTSKKLRCPVCRVKQVVKRERKVDKSVENMLSTGVLRPCPKCRSPNFKDHGICNVIQCASCQIWWNWKTRETGNSQRELKQRARMGGTLWEPGELAYQQNLQQTNLPEFVKLLAQNGIKYDPNYVRGQ